MYVKFFKFSKLFLKMSARQSSLFDMTDKCGLQWMYKYKVLNQAQIFFKTINRVLVC